MCSEPFERTRFLRFESQWKKLNYPILLLLTILIYNTFKILHFGVKFCKLFGPSKRKGLRCIISSFNILGIHNNPLEDFSWRFLFCYENSHLSEYTYHQPPQFTFYNLFNKHFSWLILFFKSILSRKNWRDGGELVLKNGTVDGYDCQPLPQPDLHCAGLLAFWRFSKHLSAK